MSDALRLGLVGCGGISHLHAAAAAAIPDLARFVACCDVRPEAAVAWARRHGTERAYAGLDEMLASEPLDGLVLATWPDQHREQIATALAAGVRHILCEKALCLDGAEAMDIHERARTAGAVVIEGFMYRHHPAFRRLEALVATGEIGAIDSVRGEFGWYDAETPVPLERRDWRQRPECGGVPYDATCYAVDACNRLCGVPERVVASATVSPAFGTVNRLHGIIAYADGRTGIVSSSRKTGFVQELAVHGSTGSILLPHAWTIRGESVVLRRHGHRWETGALTDTFTVATHDSYRLQLAHFAAVARGQAQPLLPLAASVVNAFTIAALLAAARDARAVDLAIPASIVRELEL